ncbi:MAG TPA: protein translocase subunit SecD [Gemmatimonadaceae bacterium]|jgi:preprotein translocase subunit SecD|nr:protein translocase subunit SecD [Gemmatimonadaceae bacterium]
MATIRNRVILILVLIGVSVWALFPRNVSIRQLNQNGVWYDTTERHVPLKKGLDLQGGMYLALEVDESKGAVANKPEAIDRALKVVRNRIDQLGVAETDVRKVGTDRITVELPGVTDQQRAEQLVEKSAFLEFQITDKTSAFDKVMPRIDQIVRNKGYDKATPGASPAAPSADTNKSAISSLFTPSDSARAKADTGKAKGAAASKGAATGDTTTAKSDTSDSGILNGSSNGPFSRLIQPGQIPGEYFVSTSDVPTVSRYLSYPDIAAALPPGKSLLWGTTSDVSADNKVTPLYVVDSKPIITGEYLTDAKPATDPVEGNIVQFTLNSEGGRRFRQQTGKHVNDYMAIVLDGKVMGRPPVIESAIGTRGQITMRGQPLQAVQDLALVLRAGALPVPLKVVDSRTIGATLGEDSIHDGIKAGILGIALVVLIMLGYYRFSGFLAVVALGVYVLFTLALLAGLDATLTLPGIAGMVLSVGIAVDANVLIFERIREEMARGKTVRASIDEGFRHAMSAIVDSNVSTALTAAVLYWIGTGPVKGFAVTLICGIAASMVSAIFVVRTFYLLWLNRTRGARQLSI